MCCVGEDRKLPMLALGSLACIVDFGVGEYGVRCRCLGWGLCGVLSTLGLASTVCVVDVGVGEYGCVVDVGVGEYGSVVKVRDEMCSSIKQYCTQKRGI